MVWSGSACWQTRCDRGCRPLPTSERPSANQSVAQVEYSKQLNESLAPTALGRNSFVPNVTRLLQCLPQVEYSKQLNESRLKVLQAREDAVQVRIKC